MTFLLMSSFFQRSIFFMDHSYGYIFFCNLYASASELVKMSKILQPELMAVANPDVLFISGHIAMFRIHKNMMPSLSLKMTGITLPEIQHQNQHYHTQYITCIYYTIHPQSHIYKYMNMYNMHTVPATKQKLPH